MSEYQDDDDSEPRNRAAVRFAKASTPEAKYHAAADMIYDTGLDIYPGFQAKVQNLKDAGVMSEAFVQFVMQSEKPATIIDAIGEDMDVAKKLAGQNAVQLANSIAAIERGEHIPTYENATPAYLRNSRSLDNPDLPDAQWSRQFDQVYKSGLPGFGGRRRK